MFMYLTPVVRSDSPKFRKSYALAADIRLPLDESLQIPAGFEFDGASIPPLLWPIIGQPFAPRFVRAALVHDWLYCTHLFSRDVADEEFCRLLIQDGVSEARADAMYAAVRLAGRWSWKDSEEDAAYMAYLRERIVADGRNLMDYGL